MYDYLKGLLTKADPSYVIVEQGGMGFRILIPFSTFAKLPPLGSPIQFFLTFIVREDAQLFFGFLDPFEREFFQKLITISGVGPKTALALIGHTDPKELQQAIAQEKISWICKIPGIGKKTAERIVIELRDKYPIEAVVLPERSSLEEDALAALMTLGYPKIRAEKALEGALKVQKGGSSLSQIITLALRQI